MIDNYEQMTEEELEEALWNEGFEVFLQGRTGYLVGKPGEPDYGTFSSIKASYANYLVNEKE